MRPDLQQLEFPETADGDLALVHASKNGDTAAFEEIVKRYDRRLLRIAQNLMHNRDDSEEVVQETFPKAFRHLEMRERAREKFNPKSAAEREEEQQEEEFLNGKTPKEATYDH